jgi:PhoH-like ATPase
MKTEQGRVFSRLKIWKGVDTLSKTYILDTNVLLHNPDAIFAFQENDVIIPFAVLEEIDDQKRRQDEIGRNARLVSRRLDQLRVHGHLSEGLDLPAGGTLRVEINHLDTAALPPGLLPDKTDNRILAVAYHLNSEGGNVHLVTKDINLRVKADILGLPAEDFYNDKIDYPKLYDGVASLTLFTEQMAAFYRDGSLNMNGYGTGMPHQFFVIKNAEKPSQSALSRCEGGVLHPLIHGDSSYSGIKARNKEQRFALELLMNDEIKIVSLVGCAGTGKTLLALAVGMEKVLEEKIFSRLLVTRPVVPMGNDLGYLPGSKEEKLRPWMQPIFDNLEYLFSNNKEPQQIIDHLVERGQMEIEALTYIRGRSIPKQFIICDEAQNLSPHMIKTLVTRVGEGSKIVFTGDPEQIDHPYLDASSNGLTYLVEKLKGEEIAGHVTLHKGERSAVAKLGAKIL